MSDPSESDQARSIPVASRGLPLPAPPQQTGEPSLKNSTELATRGSSVATRVPLIDIHETDDGLVLEADLPGASDKTLTIHLEHNVLHLRAAIEIAPPKDARLIQQEYAVGEFERTFILSDEVDRSHISAELKNGTLSIFLPRAERSRARRIDVRAE